MSGRSHNQAGISGTSGAIGPVALVPRHESLAGGPAEHQAERVARPVRVGLAQLEPRSRHFGLHGGNANPDFDFRYDASLEGYVFNLSLKCQGAACFTTGTYDLNFTVGSDPTIHSAPFAVK